MKEWKESSIKSIHEIPWAQEVPIIIHKKESGYKALVNDKTKETISVVTDTYQPVQHRDVWEQANKYKNYKISNGRIFNRGRTLMIEISDVKPVKRELIPGDYLESKVRIFNSYDGTRALTVQSYGLRLVCSNGMVAPTLVSNYRKIHAYQNIDISEIGKAIQLGMEFWEGNKLLFQRAAKMTVDVGKTLKPLTNVIAKKYMKIVEDNLQTKETLYDVWNELTRTITHDMQPNVNTDNLVYTQQQVNRILKPLEAVV